MKLKKMFVNYPVNSVVILKKMQYFAMAVNHLVAVFAVIYFIQILIVKNIMLKISFTMTKHLFYGKGFFN